MILQVLAWFAIVILAISHWLQVYKIHKHREVRDISEWTYVFLLTGYCCLFVKAMVDWYAGTGDLIWGIRQMATIIPVTIVIFQIKWHRGEHWHDDNDVNCTSCRNELEPDWCHCPYCGATRPCGQNHVEQSK